MPEGLLVLPPRGHRHHQLRHAAEMIAACDDGSLMLDVGCGTGWLVRGRTSGRTVGTDVYAPSVWRDSGGFVLGSTTALPFADAQFGLVSAIAALGAFDDTELPVALREIARVTKPGGRIVLLVSARFWLADRFAVHRVRSKFAWRSFEVDLLANELMRAGLDVERIECRGGATTVLVEWADTVAAKLLRGPAHRLRIGIGELDRWSLSRCRSRGRYAYVVGRRL